MMAQSATKLFKPTNSAKALLLKRPQVVEFLKLASQLLANGFSQQELLLVTWDLEILTGPQFEVVQQALEAGSSFALALQPLIASPELVVQLQIAEGHGDLGCCCAENATLIQERQQQRRQLRGLLLYPLVLFVMLLGMLLFLHFFLQPQLIALNGASPPNTWERLLKIGLLVLGLLMVIAWCHWRRLPLLTRWRHQLRWPVVGKLWRYYLSYSLLSSLAHLRRSGRSLQEILELLSQLVPNALQAKLAQATQQQLLAGRTLKQIIEHEALLPRELKLVLGQQTTAKFQAVELATLAQQNYQKLVQGLGKLLDQVQPILFVIIAAMIGGTYLKILLPLYSMMKGF